MSSYLLDTNHLSAIFKRDVRLNERIRRCASDNFGTCMPSVGELWFMVYNSRSVQENTNRLYAVFQDFEIWEYDFRAANEFGQIKAELRRMGRPIPDTDIQIAAIARIQNLTVLSADAHFRSISNLHVENWLS